MKHRVTNFGSEPLRVHVNEVGADVITLAPGDSYTGNIDHVAQGAGRTHYSVRPAERQAGFAAFRDEEDEG